ncbi:MAG: PAS domain S-box protein [Myxococcales bacterium]|nr:MAG: PAS domain S-box protein [Myxococcales bacterium]
MSIKRLYSVAALAAGITFLLVLGFVLLRWAFGYGEEQVREQAFAENAQQLELTETHLRGRLDALGQRLIDAERWVVRIEQEQTLDYRLKELTRAIGDLTPTRLAYLDASARTLASTPAPGGGEDLPPPEQRPDAAAFGELLRRATLTGKTQLSAIGRASRDKRWFVEIVVPLARTTAVSPADAATPAPDPGVSFLLAHLFMVRLVGELAQWALEGGDFLWFLDPEGNLVYHPSPSLSDVNINHLNDADPRLVAFLQKAVETEAHQGVFSPNIFGAAAQEDEYAVSRKMTLGGRKVVAVLSTPQRPLVRHLSLSMRAASIALLVLFVLVLALGQVWQRLKASEIEAAARSGISRELEKMVEARTLELNFVTRTIKDLIDSIPSALIVLDRNLNILLVNLSFYSIFSTRMVNITGRNIGEVFTESFRERLQRSLRTKEPVIDLEMRRQIEGQGEKVLLVNVLHLLGKRDRLLVVIDDITDRKVLERQLIQAEKMAGLGTLMSGIAHEINNPLNAISGMAQIIQAKSPDEELRTDAQQILQYVKRVAEIVKELSRYSRSTKVTDAVTTDIHAVIENAAAMVHHSRKMKDVDLIKNFSHDLPGIKLNVVEMEQVFINLLTNAIDALEDAAAKRGPDYLKRITLTTSLYDGKMIQVTVEDSGTGIPTKNLKSIFDPFFSTKEQGKGTGLGLSICYKIIQRYGGIILVESDEESFTKFTIRLPISI